MTDLKQELAFANAMKLNDESAISIDGQVIEKGVLRRLHNARKTKNPNRERNKRERRNRRLGRR